MQGVLYVLPCQVAGLGLCCLHSQAWVREHVLCYSPTVHTTMQQCLRIHDRNKLQTGYRKKAPRRGVSETTSLERVKRPQAVGMAVSSILDDGKFLWDLGERIAPAVRWPSLLSAVTVTHGNRLLKKIVPDAVAADAVPALFMVFFPRDRNR